MNSDGIGQYMWPRFLSAVIKIDYRRLDWCSLPLICSGGLGTSYILYRLGRPGDEAIYRLGRPGDEAIYYIGSGGLGTRLYI